MNIFTLFLPIIGITYGGLTVFTGIIQLKQKKINLWSSLVMIIGGVLIVNSIILDLILIRYRIYLLVLGLVLIQIAAIDNGFKMYGKINKKHHMVRISISILIIMLYMIK